MSQDSDTIEEYVESGQPGGMEPMIAKPPTFPTDETLLSSSNISPSEMLPDGSIISVVDFSETNVMHVRQGAKDLTVSSANSFADGVNSDESFDFRSARTVSPSKPVPTNCKS